MQQAFTMTAAAKVNLSLGVVGKTAAGFHLLSSLVAFADYGDKLVFTPDESFSFTLSGPFSRNLVSENLVSKNLEPDADNLVVKALCGLAALMGQPLSFSIELVKNLPVASGIGGGSSDAATAIKGAMKIWGIPKNPPTDAKIKAFCQSLGADVPVCYFARTALIEGLGERITPVPNFPQLPALLVNPGVELQTAAVFGALDFVPDISLFSPFNAGEQPPVGLPPFFADRGEAMAWLAGRSNDLEAAAIAKAPEIKDVLAALRALPNCRTARMSGSGATCFALFDTSQDAKLAAHYLSRHNPHWWVQPVYIG